MCVFCADEETSNMALLGRQMTAERPQIPISMFVGMLMFNGFILGFVHCEPKTSQIFHKVV